MRGRRSKFEIVERDEATIRADRRIAGNAGVLHADLVDRDALERAELQVSNVDTGKPRDAARREIRGL